MNSKNISCNPAVSFPKLSPFADDLTIHLPTSDPHRASRISQRTIDPIPAWANKNGFYFSHSKTYFIIFSKKNPKNPFPPLLLNSFSVLQDDSVECLGLTFHSRHSWLLHLKELKAKCTRALNVLKYLSTPPLAATVKFSSPFMNP